MRRSLDYPSPAPFLQEPQIFSLVPDGENAANKHKMNRLALLLLGS